MPIVESGVMPDEAMESTQDSNGAFRLPQSLSESAVSAGDGSDKPLYLMELLQTQIKKHSLTSSNSSTSSESSDSSSSEAESSSSASSSTMRIDTPTSITKLESTLIFTRSSEAAARLSRLLALLKPELSSTIATLTQSTTSSSTSRKALRAFREGNVSILITTDRASRGLDIPNIAHVISYDVPASVQFYVHRVGRTARAGKQGHAWTLLAHREARWFWKEIGGKGDGVAAVLRARRVSKVSLEGGTLKDAGARKNFEAALSQLGEEVRA